MVQTLTAKLPELERRLESNKSSYDNAVSVIDQAKAEIDEKKQEIETLKNELEGKYASVESKLPVTATIDTEGIVTLTQLETLNTDVNKVVTADVLKSVLENITDYVPEATTETLGLVKIAKPEDINTESNSVIGIETLDQIKQPVDISSFRQKGKTTQNLNYYVDVYDKTFKTVTIFGVLYLGSKEGFTTRIELPVDIVKESASIVITPINSTAIVYPTVIESKHIDLNVQRDISATVQIIACVDSQPTIVDVDTEIVEDSDEIEITITTEEDSDDVVVGDEAPTKEEENPTEEEVTDTVENEPTEEGQ